MPTGTEQEELINSCARAWITRNGVDGMLFTGPNGNSIFLPAAGGRYDTKIEHVRSGGYYWSSSLNLEVSSTYALCIQLDRNNHIGVDVVDRQNGKSIRPVCD